MRMNTLLHERHLLEAVRQGVISQTQAEALLNLARTEAGGAGRVPDTGWLGLAQAAVAAAVVGGVAVATIDHPYRTPAGLELLAALTAGGLFLGAGLALKRWRVAEAPAAPLPTPTRGAAPTPRPRSPRQQAVLDGLAEGRSVREISEELGITARTVETYRAVLKRKLGVHSKSQLTKRLVGRHESA